MIANYAPTLMRNARQLILDIIDVPDKHQEHAKRFVTKFIVIPILSLTSILTVRYSASVVMALAYGKNPKSYEDPDILAVNRCLARLGNALRPGVWKVDVFPFLRLESIYHLRNVASHLPHRYVPGYMTELHDGHVEELTLFKQQLHDIRLSMVCFFLTFLSCCTLYRIFKEKGQETPQSFGKYLLERQNELELSDNETAYLAGSMFGAGSDTTASAISVSIMAAACFPKAQSKVQEELDNVIGKERGEFECQNSQQQFLRELIYHIFLSTYFC